MKNEDWEFAHKANKKELKQIFAQNVNATKKQNDAMQETYIQYNEHS